LSLGGLSLPPVQFPAGTERTWLLTFTDDDFRVVRAGVDGGKSTVRDVGLIPKGEGEAADSYLFVLTRAPKLLPASAGDGAVAQLKAVDGLSYEVIPGDESVEGARERILKLGDKDNFWSMGPTGPCGPCTEIHYDTRPELGGMEEFKEGYDDDRVIEFWNLVFMESNREVEDGPLVPLPMQSVDTGMGLDRMAMILAGSRNVFHSPLFTPLFEQILKLQGEDRPVDEAFYQDPRFTHYAVVADHVRTVTFALCDGAKFSNEGRGYVLRRILRRAIRHGRELGFSQPFMWQVAQALIEQIKHVYPELGAVGQEARQLIRLEEGRFLDEFVCARMHGMHVWKKKSICFRVTGEM